MTPRLRQHPALYDGGEQELCDVSEGLFRVCYRIHTQTSTKETAFLLKSGLTLFLKCLLIVDNEGIGPEMTPHTYGDQGL